MRTAAGATTSPLPSLLDRRLLIVTGKGGTGKTSVSAALALAASRAGRRVLLAEVGRDEHAGRILAPGSRPVGPAGREVLPDLTLMRIDPFDALAEYLGLQLHMRAAVDLVFRNKAFAQLMEAAPGWRELITLGKIWYLAQQVDRRGRPRYELIVVDAPATGHGLTFLDVPRVVVSAVQSGPLRRNAALVEAMIADRDHTLLLPVALAEELPARETAELVTRLRDEIGVAIDRVVINAMVAAPFPRALDDLDQRLARLSTDLDLPGLPPPRVLAACASHLRSRAALNAHYRDEIGRMTGLPTVSLPWFAEGIRGPAELAMLAARLMPERA